MNGYLTKEQYGQDLERNLQDLHARMKAKRYRHQPIRRVSIPKEPGKTRPIGISAFEDKLVQNAVREVLEAIYEQDFLDCSYGFRPGRSAHDAVRTLDRIVHRGEVNWILEADIVSTHLVVGFEHERDAHAFLAGLHERFAQFGLELHLDKTRILEFGRYAADNRARRGEGKPETFDFLGFTHICAKTRNGRFTVRRQTMRKRLRAKLGAVRTELRRRITQPIPEQGAYLRAVLLGHTRYYGVPGNGAALQVFRHQLGWLWARALRRRGNRRVPTWQRLRPHFDRWLPTPHICHPWPSQRLAVFTQGRSPVR